MNEKTLIDWSVVDNKDFVKFDQEGKKSLTIVNWGLGKKEYTDKVTKKPSEKNFFFADVVWEDDAPCRKKLQVTSKRFMRAIRKILEKKSPDAIVQINVHVFGEGYDKHFGVEEVPVR